MLAQTLHHLSQVLLLLSHCNRLRALFHDMRAQRQGQAPCSSELSSLSWVCCCTLWYENTGSAACPDDAALQLVLMQNSQRLRYYSEPRSRVGKMSAVIDCSVIHKQTGWLIIDVMTHQLSGEGAGQKNPSLPV